MTKAAAPYLHARLAAVEHSATIEHTPVEKLTDDELNRRLATQRSS
jgi:hypothetical protein